MTWIGEHFLGCGMASTASGVNRVETRIAMRVRRDSRKPSSRRMGAFAQWRFAVFVFAFAVVWVLLAGSALAQVEGVERTPLPPGPYRIAGTVVNAKTGTPLARARVMIADAKKRQSVRSTMTGEDGRYEFHVPAGKFSLDGAKEGFITASYNQHDAYSTAIVTGDDFDTEHLTLRLAPNAVLGGRVLDEFQEPVRNAEVMVYRDNHFQGVSRIDRYREAMTDDQGRYEVTPIAEGTYFVTVNATPWYAVHSTSSGRGPAAQVDSSLDVVYPITYYGDATETDGAIPIPVRGGDRLEADIHLTPAPSLHLLVHVPEDGSRGISFPQLQKPTFDGMEQVENGHIEMVGPGLFELNGVAAGRYTLRVPDPTGPAREATEVDLTNGAELDMLSGNPTSSLTIAVQVAGATSLPSELQVGLRNSRGRVQSSVADAQGEASFSEVTPGKYDIVAGSQTHFYSVVRVASETSTSAGHALNVPPGAVVKVTVTLVGGTVAVEGFAKRAGKAVAGAMIVLVPKDAEADHDRFRRDQSDLDGSFVLQNVIPGSYTVIAIDDGWDLDWSQPAVLAHYLVHGQTVEVGDQAVSSVHLSNSVEVQAK